MLHMIASAARKAEPGPTKLLGIFLILKVFAHF